MSSFKHSYERLLVINDVVTYIVVLHQDVRKRLRYLNHLPLTCEFHVVELDLKPPMVSKDTLKHFRGTPRLLILCVNHSSAMKNMTLHIIKQRCHCCCAK